MVSCNLTYIMRIILTIAVEESKHYYTNITIRILIVNNDIIMEITASACFDRSNRSQEGHS